MFTSVLLGLFYYPSSFAQTSSASGPSSTALAACERIALGSAETEIWPVALTNPDYLDAKDHYYNAGIADLTPACAVFPTSADEVAYVVESLLDYPTVPFAVKSGGHNTNLGFSSVNWGVLISFSKLASTTLSSDQSTADVGPGARWVEVMTALEPYNLAVVGGRLGDVGVGGLLLGGGLSFLSAQYGLACDNVMDYEVVLANATIVNANTETNTDLFWALKGGGNQFGIVTKFTLKTYPVGMIWGGTRFYAGSAGPALLNATQNFIQYNEDPKAAIIVTGEITIENLAYLWVVFYFYNGTTPAPGVFDEFNAIVPVSDSVTTQPYASLLNANDEFSIYGLRYLYRAATIPNLPGINGMDLYNGVFNNWSAYIISQDALVPGFIFSIAFQPMQALIAAASVAAGGDALALDPGNGDRMWIDLSISWLTDAGDATAYAIATILADDINSYSKSTYPGVANTRYVDGNLAYEEYDPLYSNDCMYNQQPYQTYGGGSYARLKAIQKTVDPNGFFPGRTGGFKYT